MRCTKTKQGLGSKIWERWVPTFLAWIMAEVACIWPGAVMVVSDSAASCLGQEA